MMEVSGSRRDRKGGCEVFWSRDWRGMLLVSLAVAVLVSGSLGCMGGRIHTDLSQLTESREEASGKMTRERLRT